MRALKADKAEAPARFAAGKAPQIEEYPEIHALAHKIMLAGSVCRQDVHRADGLKRIDLMNRFGEIYRTTKDIKTVRKPCPIRRTWRSSIPSSERTAPAAGRSEPTAPSHQGGRDWFGRRIIRVRRRSMVPALDER